MACVQMGRIGEDDTMKNVDAAGTRLQGHADFSKGRDEIPLPLSESCSTAATTH